MVALSATSHAMQKSDPTRPPGKVELFLEETKTNDRTINVTAVLKKNQTFYADINQQWLKKGESISGWRITGITNSGVYLQNETEPGAEPLRFLVNENSDFKKQANDE
jgi:MSHA biogenesis protein MshK